METRSYLQTRNFDPLLSIVVPLYNEDDALSLFVTTTVNVLTSAQLKYEIVFVNDGSNDGTLCRLLELSARNDSIRVINLSRNFGKEAALTAGILAASGDVVIPMDVDLQDPPEVLPRFVEKWKEGYDVVYGVRSDRTSDTFSKRLSAKFFYRAFNQISNVKLPENAGDFRLLDRRVVEVMRSLPERTRFMKGLFAWIGFPSVGISYIRPVRSAGSSKWNFWRLWNFALDGIFSFSTAPLRVWTYIGTFVALVAFLYAALIIARVLILGIDVPGYASLLTVMLFIGGIQLLSVGVLGEYIGRVFDESKGRPVFVIEGEYRNGKRETTIDLNRIL